MNSDLFVSILLALHIFSGTVALVLGTILAILKKGDKRHKLLGKIYVYAMIGVFITALIRSIQTRNEFLLAVAFFSITLTLSALISIRRKKNVNSILPQSIAIIAFLAGLGLIVQGFWDPFSFQFRLNLIPLVFGIISCWVGIEDWRNARREFQYFVQLEAHITRMGGSLISAWTAFIVVNNTLLPPIVAWLLPTLIGTVCISFAVSKYIRKQTTSK